MDPLLVLVCVIVFAILIVLAMAAVRGKPDYTPQRTWSDDSYAAAQDEADFRASEVPWYWKERK